MKNLNKISLLFIIIISASCKKDYVCECKGGFSTPSNTTFHDTKKNAEKSCKEQPAIMVYDPDRTCALK
jgi:hypothetical protein